jgi:hypothetical protein
MMLIIWRVAFAIKMNKSRSSKAAAVDGQYMVHTIGGLVIAPKSDKSMTLKHFYEYMKAEENKNEYQQDFRY